MKMTQTDIMNLLANLPYRLFNNGVDCILLLTIGNLDGTIIELAGLQIGVYKPHIHDHVSSTIEVLCGKGVANIDSHHSVYTPGTKFIVPAGIAHGFEVAEPTWLLTRLTSHIINPKTGVADLRYTNH